MYKRQDMDKAVEFLREKGLATAQKKASRVAAEGLCKTLVAEDGKKAVVVEVNACLLYTSIRRDFLQKLLLFTEWNSWNFL